MRQLRVADVINAARATSDAATPLAIPKGAIGLVVGVRSGERSATVEDFRVANPRGRGDYFGIGRMKLTNLLKTERLVAIPYGVVIKDARIAGRIQNMTVYPPVKSRCSWLPWSLPSTPWGPP